jgi:hypothetical protein
MAVALTLTEEEAALIWAMLRTEMGPYAALLPARTVTPSSTLTKRPILEIIPVTSDTQPKQPRKLS